MTRTKEESWNEENEGKQEEDGIPPQETTTTTLKLLPNDPITVNCKERQRVCQDVPARADHSIQKKFKKLGSYISSFE
jgi:hypothetical protein